MNGPDAVKHGDHLDRGRHLLRRVRYGLWAAVALIAAVMLLIGVAATVEPGAQGRAGSRLVHRAAPALDAPTIDGGQVSLPRYRGRWVVVNFFATWCVPCRQEHPELVRWATEHRAKGNGVIVAVVFNDSFPEVRKFRRQHGGFWPVAEDADGSIATAWGIAGLPQTYLVSPRSIVVARTLGAVTQSQLDRLIREAGGTP